MQKLIKAIYPVVNTCSTSNYIFNSISFYAVSTPTIDVYESNQYTSICSIDMRFKLVHNLLNIEILSTLICAWTW